MAFRWEEEPDSRHQQFEPPSFTFKYHALNEQNDQTVMAYARAATPNAIFTVQGTLFRQNIELEPVGWAHYIATIPYGPKAQSKQPGEFTFSFDTTGGTINITAAKAHVADYPPTAAGTSLDPHKGAIGVKHTTGECEGVDIVIPALKLTYTFRHESGVVDEAMARTLARATGKTNSAPWRGFQADELLYIGSTGSDGRNAEADVAYHFVASEHAQNLTIGQILVNAKKGHDYLWVGFKQVQTPIAGQPNNFRNATVPERVFLERVYDPINFASTFGWS